MSQADLPTLAPDALANRVILVTGAGAGLGRATAIRCAAAGAEVVLLGRTIAKLESTADAIEALPQASAPALYPMDLSGAGDRDFFECIDRIKADCGALHGIAHVAAHWQEFQPMSEVPPYRWMQTLQAGLTAPWSLTRAALPYLQTVEDGCAVFVDCACGSQPAAYFGAFGVAKAAQRAMVKGWALENPGVRMHLFDPGPMRSTMRTLGYPGMVQDRLPEPSVAAETLSALFDPACGRQPEIALQQEWVSSPPPA